MINMDRLSIEVSVFAHKGSKYPVGTVNLWKWLLEENDNTSIVYQIRSEKSKEESKLLKISLPAITPSGIFFKRSAGCLAEPTNLICIDIDGKDNLSILDIEDIKKRLSKLSYIMYCGLSVSGTGVFCIIPYLDYENHKFHFNALEQEFKEMGIVVDSSCSDICRLRFYSYDANPHINPDAEVYTHTLEKKEIKSHQIIAVEYIPNQSTQEAVWDVSSEEFLLLPTNLDNVNALPLSKTLTVEKFLDKVLDRQIDITCVYADWIAICHIIKNLFDEDGRALFHQISSFYPNYDFDEADHKYSSVVRWRYKYNSDRIFEIAAKYGVL